MHWSTGLRYAIGLAKVECIQDAIKNSFTPPEKPWFDFGAGVNLELDEGQLNPTIRLKVKDFFSIKVLLNETITRLKAHNATFA